VRPAGGLFWELAGLVVSVIVVATVIVLNRSRRGRTSWAFWSGCGSMLGGLAIAGLVIVPGLIERSTWRTFDPSVWTSAASVQGTPTIRSAMARELKGHNRLFGPNGPDVFGQLGRDDPVPAVLEDRVQPSGGDVVGGVLDSRQRQWVLVETDSDGWPSDVAIEDLR
jgi:hypothetical protein